MRSEAIQGETGVMVGSGLKQAQNGSERNDPPMPAEAPVVQVGGDDVARPNFFPSQNTRPALSTTINDTFCCSFSGAIGIFLGDRHEC